MTNYTHGGTALAAAIFIALHTPPSQAASDVAGGAPQTFEQCLASDYQALSQAEHAQGDARDAATYAARAAAASAGQATAPDEILLRSAFLKERYVGELSSARVRLVDALAKTARSDAPAAAARAQSSFDCWLEQATEDLQAADIEACKQSFMTAMNTVEASPPPVAEVEALSPPPPPTPVTAPPVDNSYRVYFPFDRAVLDAAAMAVLEQVKADISSGAPRRLNVRGHASTIGAADHNMRLSQRRAEAVKAALEGMQINVESITTEARGEEDLPVPTADGVREPRNRQVFVTILP